MSLTDRLRTIVRPSVRGPGPTDGLGSTSVDPALIAGGSAAHGPSCSPDPPHGIADVLDGRWHESSGQRYLVVDRTYPPGHRHGHAVVVDAAPGGGGSWPALELLEPAAGGKRPFFIDLETTGLAGGAGTCAFLVGCGWFDGAVFKVRQFLLTGYAAERALLQAVTEAADGAALVTYNGKTFDMPLIETRFLFHRMAAPLASMPHVDLLHPARRLWRVEEPGEPAVTCRLSAVEQSVLGHVREGDVPGYEIPSRYFQFVRTGDARPLAAVLEHNRLDILSLALLTARTAALLERGAESARTGREAFGLGCLYRRAGRLGDARACFARAVEMAAADAALSAEALRAWAVLSRRARRYDEAAAAWRRMLQLHACPPHLLLEASEALAVHHEHREEDLFLARDLARRSLQFTTSASRAQAVRHRLTRLDGKLAGSGPGGSSRQNGEAVSLF